MSPKTLAERRAEHLTSLRDDAFLNAMAELKAAGPGPGHESFLGRLDAERAWQLTKEDTGGQDRVNWMLEQEALQLQKTMVRLKGKPALFKDLRVVSELGNGMSARLTRYSDASSLIAVSDALIGAVNVFSNVMANGFRVRGYGMGRNRILSLEPLNHVLSIFEDPDAATGVLRYFLTAHRLQGKGAALLIQLDPEAFVIEELLDRYAIQFVLAHELAHLALKHTIEDSGLAERTQRPACTADPERENAADILALRTVFTHTKRQRQMVRVHSASAFPGVLCALFAMHAVEQSLLIRAGDSHPPAYRRVNNLLRVAGDAGRDIARECGPSMQALVEDACMFDQRAKPFNRRRVYEGCRIMSPLQLEHIEGVERLDALQCLPETELLERLSQLETESVFTAGVNLLRAGRIREALQCWNMPTNRIDQFHDPQQPLRFYTLIVKIEECLKLWSLEGEAKKAAAVAAASVIAPHLVAPQA